MDQTEARTDIEDLIAETEHAEITALDESLPPELRGMALASFLERRSADIVAYLKELLDWRRSSTIDGTGSPSRRSRIIVEGFSDESASEALSDALGKASRFFSELHDVTMTLRQLSELREGGHRAVLEIHITPLNLRHRAHVQSLDVEIKKTHDKEFRKMRQKEDGMTHHLVFDHFVKKVGMPAATLIPEYFMINIGDAHLMNYMIEHDFFKAGHKQHAAHQPTQIMVRKIEEDEEGISRPRPA